MFMMEQLAQHLHFEGYEIHSVSPGVDTLVVRDDDGSLVRLKLENTNLEAPEEQTSFSF